MCLALPGRSPIGIVLVHDHVTLGNTHTIELEVKEKNDPKLNKHLKEQIMQLNDLIKESINKP